MNDKTIIVPTSQGDVTVKKLALGDYALVLKALKKLPQELGELFSKTDDKDIGNSQHLLSVLPNVIAEALPEYASILSIVSDKEDTFFLEGDLADAIDVTAAALDINDYSRIVESIKKIQARMKKHKPAVPAKTQ